MRPGMPLVVARTAHDDGPVPESTPTFHAEPDPVAFAAAVGPIFGADPVRHTLLLSILAQVVDGRHPAARHGVVRRGERVVAALLQTPPWNVVVSLADAEGHDNDHDHAAAAAAEIVVAAADGVLVEVRAGRWPHPPGVTGLDPHVERFARRWCEQTGQQTERHVAERLFRLDDLIPPRPMVGGRSEPATADDVAWLVESFVAFAHEADLSVVPPGLADQLAAEVTGGQHRIAWVGEQRAAFVGRRPAAHGSARVGPVYIEPAFRGRGLASVLVAETSVAIQAEGAVPVLFTDQANPTSNAIYQALGYRPVADGAMWRFTPPA